MELPKEHAEQYKTLREEILSAVAETRKLEIVCLGAIAALYAWLAANNDKVGLGAWFIATPVVILAGLRCLALYHRVAFIASYLRLIEEQFFVEQPSLPGYERFFAQKTTRRIAPTAVAFWFLLLLVTLIAPFCMDR